MALVHIFTSSLFLVVFLNSSGIFICFLDLVLLQQMVRGILEQSVSNQELLLNYCRLNTLSRVRDILDDYPELVSN